MDYSELELNDMLRAAMEDPAYLDKLHASHDEAVRRVSAVFHALAQFDPRRRNPYFREKSDFVPEHYLNPYSDPVK